MLNTLVTLTCFKKTGKFYIEEKYLSNLEPHETDKITEEVNIRYRGLMNYNHTIEVEKGYAWTKWLILKQYQS